jgi:hypothetical protein
MFALIGITLKKRARSLKNGRTYKHEKRIAGIQQNSGIVLFRGLISEWMLNYKGYL